MKSEGDTKKADPPGYLRRGWDVVWGVLAFVLLILWRVAWFFIDKVIVALVAIAIFAGMGVLLCWAFFPEQTAAVLWQGPAVAAALWSRITWDDVQMLWAIAARILKKE